MDGIKIKDKEKILVLSRADIEFLKNKGFSESEIKELTQADLRENWSKLPSGKPPVDTLSLMGGAAKGILNIADVPPAMMRTAIYGQPKDKANILNLDFYKKGIEKGFPTVGEMVMPEQETAPLTEAERQSLELRGVPAGSFSDLKKEDILKAFPERAYQGNLIGMPAKHLFEVSPEWARPALDLFLTGTSDPSLAAGTLKSGATAVSKIPQLGSFAKSAGKTADMLGGGQKGVNILNLGTQMIGEGVDLAAEQIYRIPDRVKSLLKTGIDYKTTGGTRGAFKGKPLIAPSKAAYQSGQQLGTPQAYQRTSDQLVDEVKELMTDAQKAGATVDTRAVRRKISDFFSQHRKDFSGAPHPDEAKFLEDMDLFTRNVSEEAEKVNRKNYVEQLLEFKKAKEAQKSQIRSEVRAQKAREKAAKIAWETEQKINQQRSLERFEDPRYTTEATIKTKIGAEPQPKGKLTFPPLPASKKEAKELFPLNPLRDKEFKIDPSVMGWGDVGIKDGQWSFINMDEATPFATLEEFVAAQGARPKIAKEIAATKPILKKPTYSPVPYEGIPLDEAVARKQRAADKIPSGAFRVSNSGDSDKIDFWERVRKAYQEGVQESVDKAIPHKEGELWEKNQMLRSTIEAGKTNANPLQDIPFLSPATKMGGFLVDTAFKLPTGTFKKLRNSNRELADALAREAVLKISNENRGYIMKTPEEEEAQNGN